MSVTISPHFGMGFFFENQTKFANGGGIFVLVGVSALDFGECCRISLARGFFVLAFEGDQVCAWMC